METKISSAAQEVIISDTGPTRLIGERINPTNRQDLTDEILAGGTEIILNDARAQYVAGAHVLDVNVGAPGADEATMMPGITRGSITSPSGTMESGDVTVTYDVTVPAPATATFLYSTDGGSTFFAATPASGSNPAIVSTEMSMKERTGILYKKINKI